MSRSRLQGTPWHSEYLKTNDDTRRHKTRCIYYKKGNCERRYTKCPGSAHCGAYRETINGSTKGFIISSSLLDFSKEKKTLKNEITEDDYTILFSSTGSQYCGFITLQIANEQPKRYKTSEYPNDALIFDKGYRCGVGDRFEINNISILVLKNNLKKYKI